MTTREEFLDSLARYTLAITTPPYSGITEGNALIATYDAQAARTAELEAQRSDLLEWCKALILHHTELMARAAIAKAREE
jgi:hypothetical protein